MKALRIEVSISNQDKVIVEYEIQENSLRVLNITALGCLDLLKKVKEWKPKLQGNISDIPVPKEKDHSGLLLKELVLKIKGQWFPPYQEDEICHCRAVETKRVMDAIYTGSHTSQEISKKTTASTSCGTCRPDVESLVSYIIK